MRMLSNITRTPGDPQVIETGPSSLAAVDRLGRALGWFSIGLGVAELVAPRRFTRALRMRGHEGLVRAYGAREIGAGVLSLSVDRNVGLWGRVAGDGLDAATLLTAWRSGNPKRGNVGVALAMVLGIAALDLMAAQGSAARHARGRHSRDYSDRSGFPQGLAQARGRAAAKSASRQPELSTV